MRIFKNKAFSKWAAKQGISDSALRIAVGEMARGLFDARLGGHLYKKRVAAGGKGKSGGVRTLLAFQAGRKAFFVYGFAKNARANIKVDEERALKKLSTELMGYSAGALDKAVQAGALVEVSDER